MDTIRRGKTEGHLVPPAHMGLSDYPDSVGLTGTQVYSFLFLKPNRRRTFRVFLTT